MQIKIIDDREKHSSAHAKHHLSPGETFAVVAFRFLGQRLWDMSYILLSSFRCFLGHLRTQLVKDQAGVSLGPSLEFCHQSWQRNRRTLARKEGIRMLLAIHPWADFQTLEIYLMGFDAGEQWASDNCRSKPHPSPSQDSSVLPPSV